MLTKGFFSISFIAFYGHLTIMKTGADMKSYTSRYKYLFGPVPSRRLGRSLGIEIIPHKICSMNCIYCEVGKTTECTTKRKRFARPDDIISEFSENYPLLRENIDIVTITGAGEPTLNIDMGYIIKGVKKISSHPVCVLTNSTLLTDKNVRAELMHADVVVPSIDAATEEVYSRICEPHPELNIESINEALISFSKEYKGRLLIEVLLCRGVNDSKQELRKIAEVINRCRYDLVQLNTVHRPPAYSSAVKIGEEELIETALYLKSLGVNVEPAGNYIREFSGGTLSVGNLERLLSMRPCSIDDISKVFGVDPDFAEKTVEALDSKRLQIKNHGSETFYYYK